MSLIGLDLDGTLEDSRADMAASVHRVRAGLGLAPRADEAVLPFVNRGMDALYRACFDDFLDGKDSGLEEIRNRYEDDYLANVARETRLYPGVREALEALAGLGRLAVVTNKPERISRRLLEALEVGAYFSAVVGGDSCSKPKPDPMVLEAAARLCGLKTGRDAAVMIGDSAGDIQMARAFGAAAVWCAWGYAEQPGLEPDRIARTPGELPAAVRTVFAASR